MAIQEGVRAPDFALQDTDGKTHTLQSFSGSYLLLYFYPKDDTPGCTKESCGFRDLWEQFKKLNVQVVGISPDDGTSHLKFINKYQLPFLLLCDPEKTMMEAYDAFGKKMLYGKTSLGVTRSTVLLDPQGIVIKHWKNIPQAEAHPEKALAFLKTLLQETN